MAEVILSSAEIPADALGIVQERVERVARRAEKKGFPAPSIRLGERRVKQIPDPEQSEANYYATGKRRYISVEFVSVEIVATGTMQFDGWTFIASVDPLEVDGKLVPFFRRVPGTEAIPLPEEFKTRDPGECDHCKTRRYRTETFILHHTEKGYRQVGRQCIRDFLGHDPSAFLAMLAAYDSLTLNEDEISGWGNSAPRMFSILQVLDAAARAVLWQGYYVSRNKSLSSEYTDNPVESTGGQVRNMLSPRPSGGNHYDNEAGRHWDELWAQDDAKVQALIDATNAALDEQRTKPDPNLPEWMESVLLLTRAEWVQWRQVGILASAIILGMRKQERDLQAANPTSKHVGTVGAKISMPVHVTMVRDIETRFGVSTLVKMRAEGADLVWWASNPPQEVVPGADLTLTATVKAHEQDRYSGQPVTVLTRARVGA